MIHNKVVLNLVEDWFCYFLILKLTNIRVAIVKVYIQPVVFNPNTPM
ncbi:hypothetical protein VSPL_42920 [Vibrio splendidus]|nr:hypothetical protein VSPL_42920 [Vibrio splendidus]